MSGTLRAKDSLMTAGTEAAGTEAADEGPGEQGIPGEGRHPLSWAAACPPDRGLGLIEGR